jgi:hypothetical protein
LRPADGIRLTQAINHGKGRRRERNPLAGIPVRATIGDHVDQPYAVHLKRLNGIIRDRPNCLTRRTHGFAKEVDTWDALFSLVLFEHNWLRPHIALRIPLPEVLDDRRHAQRTPEMALNHTDHPWTWQEVLHFRVYHW